MNAEVTINPGPPAFATADSSMARALLESSPVAMYHTDATGYVTYSNPEYRRLFGLNVGGSGTEWARAVHDDDRLRIEEVWADFCARPRPMKFEYRMRPAGGRARYVREELVRAQGVPGFVGTISDFTDLVAARGDLRKAETLFIDTFEQAPLGIAFADRNGHFLRCNSSFCSLLRVSTDDLATLRSGDLAHPEERSRIEVELERLWRGEIDYVDAEKRYLRGDRREVWVRSSMALVRGADGVPDCSVEFVRDISERKQIQLDLERVHKELVIASRQAGMAEVATNVLHNVGNILNSVNISASLVAERVKQSKVAGLSRVAARLAAGDGAAADRRIPEYLEALAGQLIGDQKMTLQEIASLRENLEHIKETVAMQQNYAKLCGVTETVAVADLVEDSLRLNAGAFARHGVTLERDFHEVPEITVDKHKVLQILVNLVRNAKYACDESGRADKRVTLRIERAPAAVRIAVIDNGVGIAPDNMSRLFSHGFTTRKSGHGFGLHSGALAAQDLGGSLSASSDGPGRGAAFVLEIPLVPAERSARA